LHGRIPGYAIFLADARLFVAAIYRADGLAEPLRSTMKHGMMWNLSQARSVQKWTQAPLAISRFRCRADYDLFGLKTPPYHDRSFPVCESRLCASLAAGSAAIDTVSGLLKFARTRWRARILIPQKDG